MVKHSQGTKVPDALNIVQYLNENIQRTEKMHKLEIQACQQGPSRPAMKIQSQLESLDLFASFYCLRLGALLLI